MELKHKIKTYIVVDSNELDRVVQKLPNFEGWEFVVIQESGNDSCHQFRKCYGELDEWDKKEMEKALAGEAKYLPNAKAVLNYLVQQEIIERGHYLIEVCW